MKKLKTRGVRRMVFEVTKTGDWTTRLFFTSGRQRLMKATFETLDSALIAARSIPLVWPVEESK